MLRIGDKLLLRKILFGKIGLIVLFAIFVMTAKGTWEVYQKASFAKDNRDRTNNELLVLKEREEALQKELIRLDSTRGLEEEIRHKFDVGRDGERLIVLVDAPETKKVIEVKEKSVFERIINFLGFR